MAGKRTVLWANPANEAQLWAGGWPSECSSLSMTDFPSRCDVPCGSDRPFVQLAGEFYGNLDYYPGSWHTRTQDQSQGGQPPLATAGLLEEPGLGEGRGQLAPSLDDEDPLWPSACHFNRGTALPLFSPWLSQIS